MQKIRMIAMGCGTLALALGAGHFMQARSAPDATATTAATQAPAAGPADRSASGPVELSSIELTSAMPNPPGDAEGPTSLPQPPTDVVRQAALDIAPAIGADALPVEVPTPSLACDYALSAATAPAAMVELSLDAPCARGERFTLHHNGMMFTGVTDEGGHAAMLVPALSKNAVFIASFANGEGAVANARVDSLEYYHRVAVQWQGASGIELHALEFGADFDSDGHVWSGARRAVAAAASGDQGFLTLLGDAEQPEALMAEVYTFPSRMAGRDGSVALRVEAEVTQANCARDIEAQALRTRVDAAISVQDVTLAIPGCDAVGDFLVLKNLFNDITIARN